MGLEEISGDYMAYLHGIAKLKPELSSRPFRQSASAAVTFIDTHHSSYCHRLPTLVEAADVPLPCSPLFPLS